MPAEMKIAQEFCSDELEGGLREWVWEEAAFACLDEMLLEPLSWQEPKCKGAEISGNETESLLLPTPLPPPWRSASRAFDCIW